MKEDQDPKKSTPLLDRYLQRNTMNKMQQFDDKELAEAIKSLLLKDDGNPKNLN